VFLRAFLLALALFPERERERERDHTIHSSYTFFATKESKSPRVSSVFFNPHRLFLPQKKEKIIILNNARKFSRVLIKHFLKRVSRTKANNEKVFRESAREILFVLTSSESVWKTRFIQKTF